MVKCKKHGVELERSEGRDIDGFLCVSHHCPVCKVERLGFSVKKGK